MAGAFGTEKWEIGSAAGTREATSLLSQRQPSELLKVYVGNTTIGDLSSLAVDLQALALAITASGYRGSLSLGLLHSLLGYLPCDEVVRELKGSK